MNPTGSLRRATRAAVKLGALAADAAVGERRGVTVLAYHQIGGPRPGSVNIERGAFAEQIAWLADHARVITIEAALAILRGDEPVGEPPPVVITFDDGTADFVDNAVPVLAEAGMPVTLYLATAHVAEGRSFWGDGTVVGWAGLRDALASGVVSIGSHTHSHLALDRTPVDEAVEDIDRASRLIEDELGVTPLDFAYPKALPPTPPVDAEVRCRFRSAALAGNGVNLPRRADAFALARSPVQVDDGPVFFRAKARGGMVLEGRLRAAASAWRTR